VGKRDQHRAPFSHPNWFTQPLATRPALLTSWSRCTSLEGRVGGTWSRKACCFSCRRDGANLQGHKAVTMPWAGTGGQARQPFCPRGTVPRPHSLVITDADNGPCQESSFRLAPPAPTCRYRWGPWLCLLWSPAVQDAQENVDGSLRGAERHGEQRPPCLPPLTSPSPGAARRPTVGAPSISSMTRQLGLPQAPSTDSIWVAASMCVRKASGLRSSLEWGGQERDYWTAVASAHVVASSSAG
jgi:hypothetical protein